MLNNPEQHASLRYELNSALQAVNETALLLINSISFIGSFCRGYDVAPLLAIMQQANVKSFTDTDIVNGDLQLLGERLPSRETLGCLQEMATCWLANVSEHRDFMINDSQTQYSALCRQFVPHVRQIPNQAEVAVVNNLFVRGLREIIQRNVTNQEPQQLLDRIHVALGLVNEYEQGSLQLQALEGNFRQALEAPLAPPTADAARQTTVQQNSSGARGGNNPYTFYASVTTLDRPADLEQDDEQVIELLDDEASNFRHSSL